MYLNDSWMQPVHVPKIPIETIIRHEYVSVVKNQPIPRHEAIGALAFAGLLLVGSTFGLLSNRRKRV